MPDEERTYQVFSVTYHRQGRTNHWRATTAEEPERRLIAKDVVGSAAIEWDGQAEALASHVTIHVSIMGKPRVSQEPREAEEVRKAMMEKAHQIADGRFWSRYPGARIQHDIV